ncbi:MAG: hypothetical protein LQ340_001852 [Diploschistes diacapsis]|nr:MAG: hypothetical protein LQ340_001852 [Diploschistes diacapsis]
MNPTKSSPLKPANIALEARPQPKLGSRPTKPRTGGVTKPASRKPKPMSKQKPAIRKPRVQQTPNLLRVTLTRATYNALLGNPNSNSNADLNANLNQNRNEELGNEMKGKVRLQNAVYDAVRGFLREKKQEEELSGLMGGVVLGADREGSGQGQGEREEMEMEMEREVIDRAGAIEVELGGY